MGGQHMDIGQRQIFNLILLFSFIHPATKDLSLPKSTYVQCMYIYLYTHIYFGYGVIDSPPLYERGKVCT